MNIKPLSQHFKGLLILSNAIVDKDRMNYAIIKINKYHILQFISFTDIFDRIIQSLTPLIRVKIKQLSNGVWVDRMGILGKENDKFGILDWNIKNNEEDFPLGLYFSELTNRNIEIWIDDYSVVQDAESMEASGHNGRYKELQEV